MVNCETDARSEVEIEVEPELEGAVRVVKGGRSPGSRLVRRLPECGREEDRSRSRIFSCVNDWLVQDIGSLKAV